MDRREFIIKSTGLGIVGTLSVSVLAGGPSDEKKYYVIVKRCDGCGHCLRACRDKALSSNAEGKAVIDPKKCKGCGDCTKYCQRMAIVEESKSK